MTFAEYHRQAQRTAKYDRTRAIIYNASKLAGEAGEIADKLGKGLMSGDYYIDEDGEIVGTDLRKAILKEAGDVLWHLDALVSSLGSDLDEVADINLAKLADRSLRNAILGSGDDR